jgi:hypothetical protein
MMHRAGGEEQKHEQRYDLEARPEGKVESPVFPRRQQRAEDQDIRHR